LQSSDLLFFANGSEANFDKERGEIRTRVMASTWREFAYKAQNELISTDSSNQADGQTSLSNRQHTNSCSELNNSNLAALVLRYSKKELTSYTRFRVAGISKASIPWMKRCSLTFWNATRGILNKERCDALREHLSERYTDIYARKVMNFAKAFLRYLAKTHFDTRYQAFDLFLQMHKGLKAHKRVTSRIVTKEDVENLLNAITQSFERGEIEKDHYVNYRAIVLFGAYTGQRPQATIARLTVGQFRQAIKQSSPGDDCRSLEQQKLVDPPIFQQKPVLDVLSDQDKIRYRHYCPLCPQLVQAILPLVDNQPDDDLMFKQLSFERWLKHQKLELLHCEGRFLPGDLRKYCEQQGDILQWDQSNKNYILTHGVSGVDWRFYKHPLPDSVYDVYMKYWGGVNFRS
jgi:integrase